MFIGREEELAVLEQTYHKPGFQMTILYGRRRVGKSSLITEFIKEKRATYYVASQSSLADNVEKWSKQFVTDILPSMSGISFDDFEEFCRFAANQCEGEKTIIALDEIPYIADGDETFLSRFQVLIDTVFSSKNVYFILCGSAISFMENEILSEKSPLFGRRTNQIFLKPFSYREAALFTPRYSYEEKAIVYGVTGGVAKYLSLFDDSRSLDENLIEQFFKPYGYLYEEPMNLLTQEFRTVNNYNVVISVCASGSNKVSEIADRAKISTATLSYILKSLITVGIISKETPITDEDNRKKTSYEITDGMYRFWYTYIPSAKAAIEMNKGDVFYYACVKNKLHYFMGWVFEEMCRYYTLSEGLSGRLPVFVTRVGKWWGTDRNRQSTDIDVVGIDDVNKKAIIGECKFRNEKIDKEVYEALLSRKGLIDKKYDIVKPMFFSLSGYSKWVEEQAVRDGAQLYGLEELYK